MKLNKENLVKVWVWFYRRITSFLQFFASIYTIVGVLIFILALFIAINGYWHSTQQKQPVVQELQTNDTKPEPKRTLWDNLVDRFYANIASDLMGMAFAIIFIDGIGRSRATQQEKRRLILQMGSNENSLSKEAVRILYIEQWLFDGTLRHAKLEKSNLAGAHLERADLQHADMDGAILNDAVLYEALLKRASLIKAKMNRANLITSDLRYAVLLNTDLQGAFLDGAKLQDVDLSGANLSGSTIEKAKLDEDTTLPDGKKWFYGIDLSCYTTPSHPNYWRSKDPDSPAFDN